MLKKARFDKKKLKFRLNRNALSCYTHLSSDLSLNMHQMFWVGALPLIAKTRKNTIDSC